MRGLLCVLLLAVVTADASHTLELAPTAQLAQEEAQLATQGLALARKKAALIAAARQAEVHALEDASVIQEAQQSLGAPNSDADPADNAEKVLSSWLIHSAPLPPDADAEKAESDFLQRAVKKANLEMRVAGEAEQAALVQVISRLEGLVREAVPAKKDALVLQRIKTREKMRLAVLRAYYEGYIQSDAPREAADRRLVDYQCQVDKMTALNALDVPSRPPRANMCQRLKARWETKLLVAQAFLAAMSVAEKHKKNCASAPQEIHLRVATYKLNAIANVCTDMSISTDDPSERPVRVGIRRGIANLMLSRLASDPITAGTWAQRQAKEEVHALFK